MLRIIAVSLIILFSSMLMGCGKKVAPPPAPLSPSNLTATVYPAIQIFVALYWNDNSNNEKGFYLYRKTTGQYSKIAILDPDTTSYSDIGLNPRTNYWYKVIAYNDGGESNPSNGVSIITPG